MSAANVEGGRDRRGWIALGAGLAGLGVVLGAFGAHALEERLDVEQLAWWETAGQYQMLHALGLVAWGLHARATRAAAAPAWCFALGTAVFAGTLYGLALGGPRWLGAVTPLGGTLLIVGWAWFAVQALRRT